MKLILTWLGSPAGNKITKMEEMASSKEGMEGMQDYIRNIKKYTPPDRKNSSYKRS